MKEAPVPAQHPSCVVPRSPDRADQSHLFVSGPVVTVMSVPLCLSHAAVITVVSVPLCLSHAAVVTTQVGMSLTPFPSLEPEGSYPEDPPGPRHSDTARIRICVLPALCGS